MGIVNHKRERIGVMIPYMGKKVVSLLAANLDRNLGPDSRYATILELEKRSGVGKSTLDRIRKAETSARIDNVDAIAAAYGLEAWQFLVPGLDVRNPPKLEGSGLDQKTQDMVGLFTCLDEGQKDLMLSTLRETLKQVESTKKSA